MYQIIKNDGEQFFSDEIVDFFYERIGQIINEDAEEKKEYKTYFKGSFGLHDVPLKNGNTTNVWIEFDAKLIPIPNEKKGIVDAGISQVIIYDEIPDVLLDRYNELKEAVRKHDGK
jgi:hypothetical protein